MMPTPAFRFSFALIFLSCFAPNATSEDKLTTADDSVEFLSGAKITGVVKEIRKHEKQFDFEATIGARKVVRTYPFSKVHAVTFKGNRFVLTPKTQVSGNLSGDGGQRSKTEVDALINSVGASSPDWFASTSLNYPDTLDLKWPLKAPGKWNAKKNVGQFMWEVVHPNEGRWRSGLKLVYHCMGLHEGNSTLLKRDMSKIGQMYFELLQDYPRAAYWLRKGGVQKGQGQAVMLAECYFRMGNKSMAMPMLISRSYGGEAAAKAIKLYGNMGELDLALKMADRLSTSSAAYLGNIAAGDALRQVGRFDDAIVYYEKLLSAKNYRNKEYENRYKARARESIEAINLFEKVDVASVPAGTYQGKSTGYNGQLNVDVQVASGKIMSVKVTKHREKQFYSALTDTENSILKLQTVRGVDGTSGATITSRAIVNAAAKALSGAGQ